MLQETHAATFWKNGTGGRFDRLTSDPYAMQNSAAAIPSLLRPWQIQYFFDAIERAEHIAIMFLRSSSAAEAITELHIRGIWSSGSLIVGWILSRFLSFRNLRPRMVYFCLRLVIILKGSRWWWGY